MFTKEDIKKLNSASSHKRGEHFFSHREPDWGLEKWCVTGEWPGLEESFPRSNRIILKLRCKRIRLYFHK